MSAWLDDASSEFFDSSIKPFCSFTNIEVFLRWRLTVVEICLLVLGCCCWCWWQSGNVERFLPEKTSGLIRGPVLETNIKNFN